MMIPTGDERTFLMKVDDDEELGLLFNEYDEWMKASSARADFIQRQINDFLEKKDQERSALWERIEARLAKLPDGKKLYDKKNKKHQGLNYDQHARILYRIDRTGESPLAAIIASLKS